MAYQIMNTETIFEIFRRWQAGQNKTRISDSLEVDRKTVRRYINAFQRRGLSKDTVHDENAMRRLIASICDDLNNRESSSTHALLPHLDELKGLISAAKEPVKPKTAFEIVKIRYGLAISYESFKRFARKHDLVHKKKPPTVRIEEPPAKSAQLDYGMVGRHHDPDSNRNRMVYAYCGRLSHSRMPFIQFVYSQNSESFCESTIDMLEFFEGCPEILVPDNLKSAVIKPDLYDPLINKSFHDLCTHYGVFIDPARVRHAKDKGKVERLVPSARELFRKLKHLHPHASLDELNEKALRWCSEEYGMRKHGTTKLEPYKVYCECEKPLLRPLPMERFVVPQWADAKVHPDQFIEFQRKYYSLPEEYRGQHVWVRKTGKIVDIFTLKNIHIHRYTIPNTHRAYDPKHFPECTRHMMESGYPKYLLEKSRRLGDSAYRYIKQVLSPHAFLNARRAHAMIEYLGQHLYDPVFEPVILQAMHSGVTTVTAIKKIAAAHRQQLTFDDIPPQSDLGKAMTREAIYYTN